MNNLGTLDLISKNYQQLARKCVVIFNTVIFCYKVAIMYKRPHDINSIIVGINKLKHAMH